MSRRKNSKSLKESSSGARFYLRMYASLACGSLKCDDNLLGSLKCKPCDITIYLWESDTEKNGQSQRRKNKKRDCVSADHRWILARVFLFQLGQRTFCQPVSLGFFIISLTPGRNWLKFNYHLNWSFRFEYLSNHLDYIYIFNYLILFLDS